MVYAKKCGNIITKVEVNAVTQQIAIETILSVRVIRSSAKAVLFLLTPNALVSIARANIFARLALLITKVEKLLERAFTVFLMASLRNLSPLAD